MAKQHPVQPVIQTKQPPAQKADKQPLTGETAVPIAFTELLQRVYEQPHNLSSGNGQQLQRTVGNQAVGRLVGQRMHSVQIAQRQEEEDEVQMKPLPAISALQRQEEEEEALQMQTAVVGAQGGDITNDLEQSIQRARGGGQTMPTPVRRPLEQAFNTDFSQVKIHADSASDGLNRSLSARAFTTGSDIFFRSGEYNPGSSGGQELLAHELTHVVQQSGAAVQRKLYKDADTPLEDEYYETLKKLLPDHAAAIDGFLEEDDDIYLISTFLYDYDVKKSVTIDGITYTAIEPVAAPPPVAAVAPPPVAAVAPPPVAAVVPPPAAAAIAPRDVKLGNFLNTLGYLGSDPRVRTHLGSIPNGMGKSVAVHATQYLANTNQAKIVAGTAINTIMDDVFGGDYPTAYHVTAEVHGEKAPTRNPHLFYTGEYTENEPQNVKREDLAKLLKEERERIEKILANTKSAVWT